MRDVLIIAIIVAACVSSSIIVTKQTEIKPQLTATEADAFERATTWRDNRENALDLWVAKIEFASNAGLVGSATPGFGVFSETPLESLAKRDIAVFVRSGVFYAVGMRNEEWVEAEFEIDGTEYVGQLHYIAKIKQ
jgi:hypothetical protein